MALEKRGAPPNNTRTPAPSRDFGYGRLPSYARTAKIHLLPRMM
jgi:hypothetical protein